MTRAQLKFLDKVLRNAGLTGCDNIGEWRTRAACQKNGWLERDYVDSRGFVHMRLTEKAREEIQKS